MARNPRVILSFFLALLVIFGYIHYKMIPIDDILPPPMFYNDLTADTIGYVTGTEDEPYSDHLMEGTDTFYFVDYKYQAYARHVGPDGKAVLDPQAQWYQTKVRIDLLPYDSGKIQPGQEIEVKFDPYNPAISSVPGTLGVYAANTGYLNPYLWWIPIVIVVTYVIQEIIRIATKTNDM
jgi:hypothetical protein